MITRAQRYMNAILDTQQEDGWICPCAPEKRAAYDTWAVALISKVMVVSSVSFLKNNNPSSCVKAGWWGIVPILLRGGICAAVVTPIWTNKE